MTTFRASDVRFGGLEQLSAGQHLGSDLNHILFDGLVVFFFRGIAYRSVVYPLLLSDESVRVGDFHIADKIAECFAALGKGVFSQQVAA